MMNAICKSKTLRTLLVALLTLCMVFSLMAVSAFADETVTESESETTAASESESASESATATETATETESATTAATETETTAETTTESTEDKEAKTRGIINLIVGGVILVVLVVLAIVFRKKIPVWYRGVKSECGKIVWCPKDKLKKNTLVVVVIIVALAVLIGLLDLAFSEGIEWLGKTL